MKSHLSINGGTACGRPGKVLSEKVHGVTCLNCKATPVFIEIKSLYDAARLEAFNAQEPRVFREPWSEGNITCKKCLGKTFREADRSCYGHYLNFVCSDCGHTESRLSETGMSF